MSSHLTLGITDSYLNSIIQFDTDFENFLQYCQMETISKEITKNIPEPQDQKQLTPSKLLNVHPTK